MIKKIGEFLNLILLFLNAFQVSAWFSLRELELNDLVLTKLSNFFFFILLIALSWTSQHGYNYLKILPNNTSKKYLKKYLEQKNLCTAFGLSGFLYIFLGLITLLFIKHNRFFLLDYTKFAALLIINGFFIINYYRKLKF